MIRKKPEIDHERRYGIKEICDMLCICRDTVRKYTKEEVIVPIVITSREIYYLGTEVEILFNAITTNRKDKNA